MARVARSEEERLVIAYNIKKLRKKKYPTSGECAVAFKAPHSQWSPWESGKRTPDPDSMKRIAKFFKCDVEALTTPPENWEEEKARFIKEREEASKRRKDVLASVPEPPPHPATEEPRDENTSDILAIMTMLTKVQSRYDKGEIPPEQFAAKMQSIREFVSYSYHGLMDNKQAVE